MVFRIKRDPRYKYVAMFKERIDSLLSYQKKLHEIITSTFDAVGEHEPRPEVEIKAITELTRDRSYSPYSKCGSNYPILMWIIA